MEVNSWKGKRVFLTGHTGFKGAWLSIWLDALGAKVTGYALKPPTKPSLFELAKLDRRIKSNIGDVRDAARLKKALLAAKPQIVIHMAAQPLVRQSYRNPAETYETNVMGVVNLLEAVRACPGVKAVVNVTTDKCYENKEHARAFREDEPMGGYDPYSSSKGCSELVTAAYRNSFFNPADYKKHGVALASARAGNVIGGGDWAADRLIPDMIRAALKGEKVRIRNPRAIRPWQHVLEPLSGYLWLGACLANHGLSAFNGQLTSGFNFGPALTSNRTVAELVQEVLKHWPGKWEDRSDPKAVHEAKLLNLATDKAHHFLGWQPTWGFEDTLRKTVEWYRTVSTQEAAAHGFTLQQIADYTNAGRARGLVWAQS